MSRQDDLRHVLRHVGETRGAFSSEWILDADDGAMFVFETDGTYRAIQTVMYDTRNADNLLVVGLVLRELGRELDHCRNQQPVEEL